MDNNEYFSSLSEGFNEAFGIAKNARLRGLDPRREVEIIPAADLAGRVQGLIGIRGIEELIHKNEDGKSRNALAFAVVTEICTNDKYSGYDKIKRVELALRVGTAIITEGVLVAPTEGISTVAMYKNQDGTSCLAVLYAGPIRGAGGSSAALSVALADKARQLMGIGEYKPTKEEIERYVEEIELYHTRCARLQYKPSDDDIRSIIGSCPICIDGVPTEEVEVGVHANMKRILADGKTAPITNRVRGGIALVSCEGIAQKAKKILKETKNAGLDWNWLNNVIKADVKKSESEKGEKTATFLEELVAGRPVIAYPGHYGGLRLRYGRSRFTGIAAKGISPATMIIADSFIAIGTQMKVELPGKGCVTMPVDSIEGPFVRLKNGDALRINNAGQARALKNDVDKIISLGDILITYGDFRKTNTKLQPSSYVEELWGLQLKQAGGTVPNVDQFNFMVAFGLSLEYNIPMHPKYLFEFQAVNAEDICILADAVSGCNELSSNSVFDIDSMLLQNSPGIKNTLELLNVPHKIENSMISIERDYAQSLIASLGFIEGKDAKLRKKPDYNKTLDTVAMLNKVAPFRIMRRSTFIGARIGRPEKAKERLMKPAVHVLFPVGVYASKDRNVTKAYAIDSKKFRSGLVSEVAMYRCGECKRIIDTQFCYDCQKRAELEMKCPKCSYVGNNHVCPKCSAPTVGFSQRNIDLTGIVSKAMKRVGVNRLPDVIKGVKGLSSKDRVLEPIEKGILRAQNGVYIFKDGTARFDATDVPITHFYPKEIGTSVEKLRELGYDKDIYGEELSNEDQLVEMRHQDVILNRRGADYMLKVSRFVDKELEGLYDMPKYYGAMSISDLIGKLVITLAPHISCAVLGRIIGFTDASIGLAHPYTICARRRNCDGDEDTTMLLLDALINFSKEYLPQGVGGTMDTPLILTLNVKPEEIDDEVHEMETTTEYPLELYEKSFSYSSPSDVKVDAVVDRLKTDNAFHGLSFTHLSSSTSIMDSPKRTLYTQLKTMQDKVDAEFALMDKIYAIDQRDAARRVITSHFIPDLIGNLHSFSRQAFRCSGCNARYRRVPLIGKCTKCGDKLLLTISKGGIEKYLNMAINLAAKYNLDPYIRQRLELVKEEISDLFMAQDDGTATSGQFNLSRFI